MVVTKNAGVTTTVEVFKEYHSSSVALGRQHPDVSLYNTATHNWPVASEHLGVPITAEMILPEKLHSITLLAHWRVVE